MFIRMFVCAEDTQQAVMICDKYFDQMLNISNERKILKNEKYWKIDSIYLLEIVVDWDNKPQLREKLVNNIKMFPVKLTVYGEPIEEILVVKNDEIQDFNMNDLEMINVFFDE